jgi:hypothetical protein
MIIKVLSQGLIPCQSKTGEAEKLRRENDAFVRESF